jgi:hypothetical protein
MTHLISKGSFRAIEQADLSLSCVREQPDDIKKKKAKTNRDGCGY